jgi:hypothetical protein
MRVHRLLTWSLGIVAAVLPSAAAPAEMITFVHEGAGGGTIGGNIFAPSDFVITAVGDTDDRQVFPIGSGWYIDHTAASIRIDGVGTFDILVPTRTFVNNEVFEGVGVVGFAHGGSEGLDLYDGPDGSDFAAWDMLNSIGPLTGNGLLLQWDAGPPVETTGGTLIFDTSITTATFTAIIPAPPTMALIGVVALTRQRRHR